jgi:hypothetical protein
MALESVALFILTAILFSSVPLMGAAIELKEVFFKFVILLLTHLRKKSPSSIRWR